MCIPVPEFFSILSINLKKNILIILLHIGKTNDFCIIYSNVSFQFQSLYKQAGHGKMVVELNAEK